MRRKRVEIRLALPQRVLNERVAYVHAVKNGKPPPVFAESPPAPEALPVAQLMM